MVLINGVKYACDRCIRGHRVTSCTHTDQPLTMIKPKGRPSTTCEHCKSIRLNKNYNPSGSCTCGKHLKPPKKRRRKQSTDGVSVGGIISNSSDVRGGNGDNGMTMGFDPNDNETCYCGTGKICKCHSTRRKNKASSASNLMSATAISSSTNPSSQDYNQYGLLDNFNLDNSHMMLINSLLGSNFINENIQTTVSNPTSANATSTSGLANLSHPSSIPQAPMSNVNLSSSLPNINKMYMNNLPGMINTSTNPIIANDFTPPESRVPSLSNRQPQTSLDQNLQPSQQSAQPSQPEQQQPSQQEMIYHSEVEVLSLTPKFIDLQDVQYSSPSRALQNKNFNNNNNDNNNNENKANPIAQTLIDQRTHQQL